MVSRSEIEAALWKWSGWKADQRAVNELLSLVDQYAGQPAPLPKQSQACHVPDWRGKPVPVDPDCAHAKLAQMQPWTFDDLPEDERKRLLTLRQADMARAYKRGQEAASDPSVRPPERMDLSAVTDVVFQGYRSADGGLWLRIGQAAEELDQASTLWKQCSTCAVRKPLSRFRYDKTAEKRGRRGLRAECKDCENEKRRNRNKNKINNR